MSLKKDSRILNQVILHNGSAYGVTLYNATGYSFGYLYPALSRMEKKGYVTSLEGDPTPKRGNRPKKFYTITPSGRIFYEDAVFALYRRGVPFLYCKIGGFFWFRIYGYGLIIDVGLDPSAPVSKYLRSVQTRTVGGLTFRFLSPWRL